MVETENQRFKHHEIFPSSDQWTSLEHISRPSYFNYANIDPGRHPYMVETENQRFKHHGMYFIKPSSDQWTFLEHISRPNYFNYANIDPGRHPYIVETENQRFKHHGIAPRLLHCMRNKKKIKKKI
ncbi:unnamed protein product [Bursaphelenchus xylophilus]|uniref:(pine wood nematode) hypothetical protein n=1 Tax=Bursaphelenchus xylophilus TaxID=6326 RepID=A0A811K9F9_BURXY|nr:unnamed protein product [Bursaphelenchus xylophilus]CAG9088746.1 unnamed protein product [Bursaphelenchus xylophilus]